MARFNSARTSIHRAPPLRRARMWSFNTRSPIVGELCTAACYKRDLRSETRTRAADLP